jgi:hypothetical protein
MAAPFLALGAELARKGNIRQRLSAGKPWPPAHYAPAETDTPAPKADHSGLLTRKMLKKMKKL